MTINYRTNLSQKIIEHLRNKKDRRDVLDGIVIAIYEMEIKKLSEKIMLNLSELIAKGIVSEYENDERKQCFKLE